MPRTFTLARLMLGITAFCILCGLLANFPVFAFPCAAVMPMMIVSVTLALLSCRPIAVLILASIGGFIAILLMPTRMQMGPPPQTIWHWATSSMLVDCAVYPPLGALLFGGAALWADILQRRRSQA